MQAPFISFLCYFDGYGQRCLHGYNIAKLFSAFIFTPQEKCNLKNAFYPLSLLQMLPILENDGDSRVRVARVNDWRFKEWEKWKQQTLAATRGNGALARARGQMPLRSKFGNVNELSGERFHVRRSAASISFVVRVGQIRSGAQLKPFDVCSVSPNWNFLKSRKKNDLPFPTAGCQLLGSRLWWRLCGNDCGDDGYVITNVLDGILRYFFNMFGGYWNFNDCVLKALIFSDRDIAFLWYG